MKVEHNESELKARSSLNGNAVVTLRFTHEQRMLVTEIGFVCGRYSIKLEVFLMFSHL